MSYENIRLTCFSCPNVYNCKYYKNDVWVQWMLSNDGVCAAANYTYESIFLALEKQKERIKTLTNQGSIGWKLV